MRIYWKYRKYLRYDSWISRTDSLHRWQKINPRWTQRCIQGTQKYRERNRKRRDSPEWNLRIWTIYWSPGTIQDPRMIYLWEWDWTSQSWNRDISSPWEKATRYLMRRANQDRTCKNTSLSTWFSTSWWTHEFYRSLQCWVARTLSHQYLERWIYHCLSWSWISRWNLYQGDRNEVKRWYHLLSWWLFIFCRRETQTIWKRNQSLWRTTIHDRNWENTYQSISCRVTSKFRKESRTSPWESRNYRKAWNSKVSHFPLSIRQTWPRNTHQNWRCIYRKTRSIILHQMS